MDYYEELGLVRTASAEEIRRAYKNLARLLHPDQQQDPELRRLAECQMKRLNAITSILADPQQRRGYDRELALATTQEIIPARPRRRILASLAFDQRWVWLAAALIGTTALLSYFGSAPRARTEVARAPAARAVAPASQPAEVRSSPARAERRRRSSTRRRAQSEPIAGESEPGTTLIEAPLPSAVAVALKPAAPLNAGPAAVRPSPPPAPRPALRGLAGTWFYTPPKVAEPTETLYPPEFIETVIFEDDGVLSGRYRARYKVSDRAISPEVLFQFRGRAAGDRAELEWTAGGGGRGGVQLQLLSEDQLEVTWSATDLGTSLGLSSGRAILTRRHEF